MPAIKALDRIGEKWSRMAQAASADYEAGVRAPKKDWAQNTAAATNAYQQGVQAAISAGRFAKGVTRAGNQTWQQGAIEKGAPRYSQGVAIARQKYETNFAPYRQVIANTQLPNRGPKGDPANINRVAVLAKALRDERVKRLGA
jgi:hypothetical protein